MVHGCEKRGQQIRAWSRNDRSGLTTELHEIRIPLARSAMQSEVARLSEADTHCYAQCIAYASQHNGSSAEDVSDLESLNTFGDLALSQTRQCYRCILDAFCAE